MLPVFFHRFRRFDMKNTPLLAVLAGLTFAAGNALAAADGAKLYQEKTCVACHGKDAKKPGISVYRFANRIPLLFEVSVFEVRVFVVPAHCLP